MTDARRGDVWLIDLGEPVGPEQGWRRPAVIVSSDNWNEHARTVIVVPLTPTRHELPTRIEIEPGPRNGLLAPSYARTEDVRAIAGERLVRRLGRLEFASMHSLGRVLRLMLEL